MDFDAKTGTFCRPVRDRLVRAAGGKLYLVEEPTEPDEREVVRPLSREQAFYWLRYYSWQIERTVIESAKPESSDRSERPGRIGPACMTGS
ncbi:MULTISPECIES: hypothetical protein [Bradyrhizobium]|uniref:hypothetical protein n=1 Tax=Bradyrhizobium liaoningense TaxID=43992 RepID=UPI00235CF841|nr:hypothetical protein [Bradyrhizobium liaoningense]GLR93991.1 hypothetical protein GCM10007858_16190 [Bradyrhizobium liaoningense]